MQKKWLVRAEVVLLGIGCCGTVAVAASLLPRALAERRAHAVTVAGKSMQTTDDSTGPATPRRPHAGAMIGELRMPALGLTSPVYEGCTTETLRNGSCRMQETASIGGLGTTAIAGHRDASFRALQSTAPRQEIDVTTPEGTYRYQVDGTRIVAPEDVAVLARQERPGLVLITCYPFYFVGAAPKRFIVQAHLLSAAPSN